jgi:hypothetical protein
MLGLLCVALEDQAVEALQRVTDAVVVPIERANSSTRRFIYLANVLERAIRFLPHRFVIVRTNWIQELADAPDEFIGAARALDRVFSRFCAVNVIRENTLQRALVKMETLQIPRRDVLLAEHHSTEEIVSTSQTLRALQLNLALDPTLVNLSGSPSAKALLVGERINPYLSFPHWPFFDDRDSARYISEALEKACIVEQDLLWTNSQPSKNSVIQIIMAQYPRLKAVALGNVAHEELDRLEVPHARVAHPQYARRFDSKGNYDVVLEKAIRG